MHNIPLPLKPRQDPLAALRRAFLSPKNVNVDDFNNRVLDTLPSAERTHISFFRCLNNAMTLSQDVYYSADSVKEDAFRLISFALSVAAFVRSCETCPFFFQSTCYHCRRRHLTCKRTESHPSSVTASSCSIHSSPRRTSQASRWSLTVVQP
jgi:hypothetical protein